MASGFSWKEILIEGNMARDMYIASEGIETFVAFVSRRRTKEDAEKRFRMKLGLRCPEL